MDAAWTKLQVHTDSASALRTCNRQGLGKSRHVQTRYLWIQEKLSEKIFELFKIDARLNTADLCTKSLAVEASESHLKRMGFANLGGTSAIAKNVVLEPVRRWTAAGHASVQEG